MPLSLFMLIKQEYRMKVRHRRWPTYHGYYLDNKDVEWNEERTQSVVKVTFILFIPVWQKTIYHEIVPSFAWIQKATCGSTDWKSTLPLWAFKLKTI